MTLRESIHKDDETNQSSGTTTRDQDSGKGAVESDDKHNQDGNTNMQGQLGHRDKDKVLKDSDSNLPG